MIRVLATVFLSLWAAGAAAQTLQVRSGEHGDFTRLVIDIERGTRWNIEKGPDPYNQVIKFPGKQYTYDTSEVFSRINKDRLTEVGMIAGTGDLGLRYTCECSATAFLLNGTMLVLDIAKSDPDSVATPPSTNPPGLQRAALGASLSLEKTPAPPMKSFGALPLDKLANSTGQAVSDPATEDSGHTDPGHAVIAELERDIAEQLARAATTGLLDVSENPITSGAEPKPDVSLEHSLSHDTSSEDQHGEQAVHQDIPRSMLADGRILLSGDNCVEEADLTLADWADETPFERQLSDLRLGLIGEFDRLNPQVATKLAKFYLHYGMGPEAKVLLQMLDSPPDGTLEGLAALMDGEPDPAGTFSSQTHCESSAAMWSLLDLNGATTDREINKRAILSGFEALPDNLKGYLADRLVNELLVLGEKATAQDLLKRLTRSLPEPSPEIELARAKMDIDEGHLSAASARLTQVAHSTSNAASAHAVETLMEIAAENGIPAEEGISELASAYSVEFRGSEEGPGLWRAHLRALIGNGDFDEVFRELNSETSGDPQIDSESRTEAANALIRSAGDVSFMRNTLAASPEHPLGLERSTLLAAANRMLSVGLPDAASLLLADIAPDRGDREARVLNARVLLAQVRPEDAEIMLIGLQGPDILELRAEARSMMGDYDYAESAPDENGSPDASTETAWISSDWTTDAQTADGPASDAARSAPSDRAVPDAALTASLGGSKALVGDSETTRETMRALLEATQISPDS
ncbi:hypothetical protein [Puniceibacterium sediminis]|uniref:HEAT repeat domain-containing protein n=1 Tax=Puniceibacterium sediminis TaxID=1608407 RepID=A0A238VUE9_9RHOB|nr:hypothetical protein [Puniceibacterium sediminis]SNR37099.1 hypothetical protein SAMN06265370_10385 [Puniceibacterium sediminis]